MATNWSVGFNIKVILNRVCEGRKCVIWSELLTICFKWILFGIYICHMKMWIILYVLCYVLHWYFDGYVVFLCLRPVGRRRHYVFGLSVRPSVRTRISLTRNLKNPLVDFHHTWPRGAPWRVDELIRFWARSAQGQRSKVNELGLNMLFLPR